MKQSHLMHRVVAHDQLVLLMSANHPWRDKHEIVPSSYREQGWIMRESGSGTRSEFERHLRASGISVDDLNVLLELPSNEAVLAAVAGSEGLAVLSRRAAEAGGLVGRIKIVPGTIIERSFTLLVHPDRYRTRAARSLLSQIGVEPG